MNGRNNEGYRDPTAETAIRNVTQEEVMNGFVRMPERDRTKVPVTRTEVPPLTKGVSRMVSLIRDMLDMNSYILVRLELVDKRNGRTYKWEDS